MSTTKLDPYLFFKGNCREVMEFYQSVFGGELTLLKEGSSGPETATNPHDKIMHAWLSGGDISLMASDGDNANNQSAKVVLCLSGTDEDRLRELFDQLGKGGSIDYPLEATSWGAIFGSLRDKHGVEWMVNITKENS